MACLLCDPAGHPMALEHCPWGAGPDPQLLKERSTLQARQADTTGGWASCLSKVGRRHVTSCLSSRSTKTLSSGTVFSQPPTPSTPGLGPPPAAPDAWDSFYPFEDSPSYKILTPSRWDGTFWCS